MENNQYIDIFKNLIKAEFFKSNGSKSHIDNLFPQIKDIATIIATSYDIPIVDDLTLENYFQTARKEFLSVHPIDPGLSHSLTKKGFSTWLTPERKTNTSWDYSDRYFKYLLKIGRSEKVVKEIKNSSMAIIEKVADPNSNIAIYKKGLVVGEVQSGKTGNFNGVINRAIDTGYGLIIVLSGIMEDLRSQTQERIESDVIGEGLNTETLRLGKKGVGEKICRFGPLGSSKVVQVKSITSVKSDFSKAIKDADFTLNDINILVCKKNVSVLKNLIVWLHDYLDQYKDKHNIPLLIIDDEADNASLNNAGAKGREYASKINGHIRALLGLFNRKTYLGYTATPFANVLQDRNEAPENKWIVPYKVKGETIEKELDRVDNIFPDDFIELLNPPSNYIGAKQIFETIKEINNSKQEKIPLYEIEDNYVSEFPSRVFEDNGEIIGVEKFISKEDWDERNGKYGTYLNFNDFNDYRKNTRASKKDDSFPKALPLKLKDAIGCFILGIAIRESRKAEMMHSALYNPHNTMLIHISRFITWQNTTKKLVVKHVENIVSKIQSDNPSSKESIFFELRNLWYRYYADIVENIRSYLPVGYEDEFMKPIIFDSLQKHLPEAVKGLEVKAINSVTKDSLEYPRNDPKKIIAIGGNRLSRGFTLEGLTINYFVRTTDYSDTLLQMGRWFGYRPGYLDCCKIFTTQESFDKFNSTTRCIEELEGEFRKMERQGREPRNFALRVKKHPGALKITRPSILKTAKEVKWSYEDQLEMTTEFKINKEKINTVWKSFIEDVAPKLNKSKRVGFLTHKTDADGIINILNMENNFPDEDISTMVKFIELCKEKNKLTNWTVALKTTGNAKSSKGKGVITPTESNLPFEVSLSIRRGPKKESNDWDKFLKEKKFKATGKNANIVSAGKDFSILLSEEEIITAEKEFKSERALAYRKKDPNLTEKEAEIKANKVNVPERVYRERNLETEGLLIIYLFDSYYSFNQEKGSEEEEFKKFIDKEGINLEIPLVGYAIGFPPIENAPGGEYMQGDYELDDEEAEDLEELVEDLNQA